jgi:hypothetical protein
METEKSQSKPILSTSTNWIAELIRNPPKPKGLIMIPGDYNGTERRTGASGRRSGDTCSQHCILVKQWEDQKLQHKEDQKDTEDRLKSAAPLWAVIILCGLVASSIAYTFKTSAEIQEKISEKMWLANNAVTVSLTKIQTDLAIFETRQRQVMSLLERHISKFETVNGQKKDGNR